MPILIPVGHNYAIVDEPDYHKVAPYKWHMLGGRYAVAKVGGKTILMHRLIMGDLPGTAYDHRNGFGLDNRQSNLRKATQKENMRNCRKRQFHGKPDKITSSKYKGVSWRKDRHRWQAYIGSPSAESSRQSLGCYATEEEAATAYNAAAIVRFGEFAKLNDITNANI